MGIYFARHPIAAHPSWSTKETPRSSYLPSTLPSMKETATLTFISIRPLTTAGCWGMVLRSARPSRGDWDSAQRIGVFKMDIKQVSKLIKQADIKGEIAKDKPGMVYQLWEDGEVTLQKCGPLLGCRNLHMIGFPVKGLDLSLMLPHRSGEHSFVWLTSHDEVNEILDLINPQE